MTAYSINKQQKSVTCTLVGVVTCLSTTCVGWWDTSGDLNAVVRKLLKDLRTGIYSLIMLNIIKSSGPIHGYALRAKVMELSDDTLTPSESTIYESLKYLEKRGLISSFWGKASGRGPPRKYYVITDYGKEVLRVVNAEALTLAKLLQLVAEDVGGLKH